MSKKIKLSLIFTLVLSVMVCLFGGIMMQSASASNEYQSFVMQNGATVKLSEETAIRFTTEISKSDYQAVKTKYGEDAKIEIITVITRTDYLNKYEVADEDFTIDNLLEKEIFFKNIKFSVENGRFVEKGDKYICNACLYDVDVTNVAEEFSARSFLCVNDSVIDKTDYSEENNAVSVYEVAKMFNGIMENDWENEILAELCADYEIKIAATDYNEETSITVKVGETINDYKAQIESELNVENFAYFAGLEGADMNAPVESGATYTPNYRAVIMEENETGYTVKGITLKDTDTTVIEIPETFNGKTVNTVGSGAFWDNLTYGGHNTSNNTAITKIVLPESVTTIKGRAFSNLGKLETIIMPGVTTIAPTGNASLMFYDCAALKTIVVGESLSVLQGGEGITDHRIFYSDVDVVGVDVYYSANNGWWSIHEASYSNKMLSGKQYYYSETDCLNTWHYDDNGNIVKSSVASHGAYENGVCSVCGRIQTTGMKYALNEDGESYAAASYYGTDKEIYVAGVYNGKPVTKYSAWNNGLAVEKVVFPESITYMDGAFFNCRSLKVVIMSGVISWEGINKFHNDAALEYVVVNANAKITDRVFHFDKTNDLAEHVGSTVLCVDGTSSSGLSFSGDYNLLSGEKLYYYEKDCVNTWRYTDSTKTDIIISNVTEHSYEDGLCENCGALQTAGLIYTLRADGESYKVTGYKGTATEIYVAKEYNGKPVTEIGGSAFWRYGNTNFTNYDVTKVVLPECVTTLGGSSFRQMGELVTLIAPGVTEINTDIGNMQFYNCLKLKTVVFGDSFVATKNSADWLNSRVFYADSPSTAVKVDIYLSSIDGGVNIYSIEDRNNMISGKVYYYCVKDCLNTWKYDANGNVVKSTVTEHSYEGGYCSNCGALQTQGVIYTLKEDGQSYVITGYSGSETELYFANVYRGKPVTELKASTFFNNKNIKKVVFGKNLTKIGGYNFMFCENLETVIAPGVTYIDTTAETGESGMHFHACAKLKTVVFGDSITIGGPNRCFSIDGADDTVVYAGVNIYLTSADGTLTANGIGHTSSQNRMLSQDRVFHYSATEQAGCWHYDANGMPVLW